MHSGLKEPHVFFTLVQVFDDMPNFHFFVGMHRSFIIVMLASIFLSACVGGPDKNKGNNAIQTPQQPPLNSKLNHGADLYSRYGCFACHSLDGKVMYGPPLNGLYLKEVSVVRRGREKTIVADREYFIRAITDPDYEKVSEYQHRIMPVPDIPREDVETLVDYLIGLGEKESTPSK